MSSKGATTTPSGIEIPYTEVAMNELKKALIRIEAGASNLLERYKYSAASDIMLAVSSIRSEARGALAITDANKEPAEGDALVLAARAVVEEWAVAWERMRRGELVGAFGDVNPAVEALRAALSGEPPKEPFTKSELHVDCPNFITTRAEHRKAHKQRIQHLHQTLLHEDDPQFAGEDELVVPHEPAGEPSSGGVLQPVTTLAELRAYEAGVRDQIAIDANRGAPPQTCPTCKRLRGEKFATPPYHPHATGFCGCEPCPDAFHVESAAQEEND
jgi:hypothetical protein